MIFTHLYHKTLLGLCGHSQIFFENKKEIKKKSDLPTLKILAM